MTIYAVEEHNRAAPFLAMEYLDRKPSTDSIPPAGLELGPLLPDTPSPSPTRSPRAHSVTSPTATSSAQQRHREQNQHPSRMLDFGLRQLDKRNRGLQLRPRPRRRPPPSLAPGGLLPAPCPTCPPSSSRARPSATSLTSLLPRLAALRDSDPGRRPVRLRLDRRPHLLDPARHSRHVTRPRAELPGTLAGSSRTASRRSQHSNSRPRPRHGGDGLRIFQSGIDFAGAPRERQRSLPAHRRRGKAERRRISPSRRAAGGAGRAAAASWRRLAAGQGPLALIQAASPGVGKTRLIGGRPCSSAGAGLPRPRRPLLGHRGGAALESLGRDPRVRLSGRAARRAAPGSWEMARAEVRRSSCRSCSSCIRTSRKRSSCRRRSRSVTIIYSSFRRECTRRSIGGRSRCCWHSRTCSGPTSRPRLLSGRLAPGLDDMAILAVRTYRDDRLDVSRPLGAVSCATWCGSGWSIASPSRPARAPRVAEVLARLERADSLPQALVARHLRDHRGQPLLLRGGGVRSPAREREDLLEQEGPLPPRPAHRGPGSSRKACGSSSGARLERSFGEEGPRKALTAAAAVDRAPLPLRPARGARRLSAEALVDAIEKQSS